MNEIAYDCKLSRSVRRTQDYIPNIPDAPDRQAWTPLVAKLEACATGVGHRQVYVITTSGSGT